MTTCFFMSSKRDVVCYPLAEDEVFDVSVGSSPSLLLLRVESLRVPICRLFPLSF